jgi:hypothetical protein
MEVASHLHTMLSVARIHAWRAFDNIAPLLSNKKTLDSRKQIKVCNGSQCMGYLIIHSDGLVVSLENISWALLTLLRKLSIISSVSFILSSYTESSYCKREEYCCSFSIRCSIPLCCSIKSFKARSISENPCHLATYTSDKKLILSAYAFDRF